MRIYLVNGQENQPLLSNVQAADSGFSMTLPAQQQMTCPAQRQAGL